MSGDLIPPAGTQRTRQEWRLWKLVTYPDGHVKYLFMARGERAYVLETGREMSGGSLPARWLLQQVYVCEVFGGAEEISGELLLSEG